jgi:predicted ATPase/DNA-binding SARP family transcriptional activator
MNDGRAHKRETLAALFWPNASAKDGRNNLRQALFKLKQSLGSADAPFFLTTRTTIQFNRQPDDWLDVEALTTAGANELLRLYTAPFLDQLYLDDCQEFEEWTLIQREWVHQQAMNRFYDTAERTLAAGDYETAAHLAARQISLDRWREAARRQLMRVLAAQGKYSAALAQYETCRLVLADELGVEPARETTALYHSIQANMQTPDAPVPQYNLPVSATPFIGRAAETEKINGRLSTPACRLLTLVGPGGIGKTRLALHAAATLTETFRDGIFFVPLAPISPAADPEEQIIHAIATAVNLTFSGPTPPRRQLTGWLHGKNILLLIDNMEHMLAGAGAITYLLQTTAAGASCKILATSRQRLSLAEEWVMPVRGMAYPAVNDSDVAQFDAMKLFWQRARMINPNFSFSVAAKPFAAQICRMTGGHPLAITLAASWTRVIPCAEIAAEMKRDLAILQTHDGDVESRHQDLHTVLRQSWEKLSPAAQASLLKLALLPGGFTRKTGTAVAQATLFVLQELVDYAFLSRDEERYYIHELLRQFAVELLARRGDEAAAKEEMMGYYGRFLQEKTAELHDERHRAAIRAIHSELANIRACWQWACELKNSDFLHAGMESIALYYEFHGLFQEGKDLFAAAEKLAADDNHFDDGQRGRFQARRGLFLHYSGQVEESGKLLKLALAQAEKSGDEMEAGFCTGHLWRYAYTSNHLDDVAYYAQRTLDIARRTGDMLLLGAATNGLVGYHIRKGEFETAEAYNRESLAVYKRLGSPLKEASATHNLAFGILFQGKNKEAEQLLRDCLAVSVHHQDVFLEMRMLISLSWAVSNQKRYEEAIDMLERALSIARSLGYRSGEGEILRNMGEVYIEMGAYNLAHAVLHEALPIHREVNSLWATAFNQLVICDLLLAQGKLDEAEEALATGLALAQESGEQLVAVGWVTLAKLRLRQGDRKAAAALAQQVLDSAEAIPESRKKAQLVLAEAG